MKKYLIIGVIIIFVVNTFTLSISAINSSNHNFVTKVNYNVPSISESFNSGFDIAILDIVPYMWYPNNSLSGQLRLSPEIKNVGDASFSGWIKYYGNASFFINNKVYSYAWGAKWGIFNPGVTWSPKSGHGILFVNYFPRIFRIEFEIYPIDSNPENNRLEQVYFIWGSNIFPFWRHLPLLEFF
jgi:hypothetical protein